jgi:hypothetical protein
MARKDPRVDAYIAKAEPFARPILTHLRKVVHAGCPGVEETMKWSFPHFEHQGVLCSMAAFQKHCAFGFWKGALLKGAKAVPAEKRGEAMGQFGRITKKADLPSERALIALVRQAAALNEQKIKLPARKPRAAAVESKAPDYFLRALRKNEQAIATWKGFTPGRRKEYVEWITEAKTEETRQRRLATAVEWIAEGKERNWKYASKARTAEK